MWRSTANGAYELRQGKGRRAHRSGKGLPAGGGECVEGKNSTEEQFHGAVFVIRLVPTMQAKFRELEAAKTPPLPREPNE